MKAAVIKSFGPSDVFEYTDVETPSAGEGEIIVKVDACGINRYDLYMRMGAVFTDVSFPHILGADVAGTVAETGNGVTQFKSGDDVIVSPGYPIDSADWNIKPENLAPSFEVTGTHTWGGNAEYIRIPEQFLMHDNTGQPKENVAAIPLCLMTACHAVVTLGEVKEGDRVLVQAGASGSGHICIQIAKLLGAQVATTVGSNEKFSFVEKCGADLVINRKEENFVEKILDWTNHRGADVIIDNVGASVFEGNMQALKKGGFFVNFGLVGGFKTELDIRRMFFQQHQLRGSMMGSLDELKMGLDWFAEKKIDCFVDKTFPLSEIKAAHDYIDSRQVQGKVILVP